MKLEAQQRLDASRGEPQILELRIECHGDAYQTLVNLLGAIEYNTMVGSSRTVGAFFDGDGADLIKITGLPKDVFNKDMAEALSGYGGVFEEVHTNTAISHSIKYGENDQRILQSTKVYPPEDKDEA